MFLALIHHAIRDIVTLASAMGVLRTVRFTILANGKSSPSKVEENP